MLFSTSPMKRMRKKWISIFLVVILTLSLAGCGGSGGDSESKDMLTVVISADPGSLDPHDTTGNPHHQVTRQIFETLLVRDSDGELAPWLAESWEYEDDTTLIMHLREGVLFTNGEEMKASDVLFSLKRMRDDNTTASMQVEAIDFDKSEVVDDYTVKICTINPSPMLLAMLENPLCGIISEKAYNDSNADFFGEGSVGTGPYKLVSYSAGDQIVMEANEDYWIEGQPKIKNLTFRIITDSSSRAIEAESGGADIVYDIGATDVERVGETENVNLIRQIGANTQYLTLNATNEPLDDFRVRQAIIYALDRSKIAEVAYGDFGMEATGLISPGIDGRIEMTDAWPERNLDKAKELLAEAGYPDGLSLDITAPNSDQIRMDICEAVQAQLAEAGITLEINYKEYNTWISDMTSGNATLGVYGFTASTGEAGRVLMRWMEQYTESKIFNWYDDDYIATCTEALQTLDDEKRNELFAECQNMIAEACVAYPIWHKELNAALQDDVKGFEMQTSYEQHYLQTVYFE
ncbi:ABC transporter substrate-binding protein [Massilistercora timonensis]|uniref:ABC transporter substrate-binding protein n=1 Tax=Massilistercora timonensis TaxID=2086584 RepID=UPI0032079841